MPRDLSLPLASDVFVHLSRRHTEAHLNRNCYFYGICGQSQISLSPAASSDRNYFSLLIWVAADEGFATVGRV